MYFHTFFSDMTIYKFFKSIKNIDRFPKPYSRVTTPMRPLDFVNQTYQCVKMPFSYEPDLKKVLYFVFCIPMFKVSFILEGNKNVMECYSFSENSDIAFKVSKRN